MVDEDELEKLREERQEKLQNQESSQDAEEAREQQIQQLWNKAKSYMTSDASSRLANIKVVNQDLAMAVAQQIVRLGESGQINTVNDQKMKKILKSLQEEKEGSESNIKFRK